jgi:hypothetical protein
MGKIFSEHFGFPCQFSFQRLLHTYHLSPGAGTISQLVADVPSGLSRTPPKIKMLKKQPAALYRRIMLPQSRNQIISWQSYAHFTVQNQDFFKSSLLTRKPEFKEKIAD